MLTQVQDEVLRERVDGDCFDSPFGVVEAEVPLLLESLPQNHFEAHLLRLVSTNFSFVLLINSFPVVQFVVIKEFKAFLQLVVTHVAIASFLASANNQFEHRAFFYLTTLQVIVELVYDGEVLKQ